MMMSKTEPETLSGVYNDLLGDLNEAVQWAKGEVSLPTTTRTRIDAPLQTITLEPDVAAVFESSVAVNEALRYVIKIAKENPLVTLKNATTKG